MSVERVTFTGSDLAGIAQNVVHFFNPDGVETHTAIAAYLNTHWITPLLTFQSNGWFWSNMTIQRVDSGPGIATNHAITPFQGTQAGDMNSPYVAALFQISTAVPGRRGRGRIYIPGIPMGVFPTQGKTTPTGYANFQSLLFNAWRTKFCDGGTAPITLCVCSRATPADFKLATNIDVRLWTAPQRRRNYFIGV